MNAPFSHPARSAHSVAPAGQRSDLIDQAFAEFCRRREAGEAFDHDEFCAEFPGLQSSLRLLIGAEMLLEEHPSYLGPTDPIDWPEAGDDFLGLKLERELGRGAFGRVFLATEPALGNRRVAVKVAWRGGAEASTLGRLKHPNIVPVHSLREDRHSGLTAVIMPYEGAVTLSDLLEQVVRAGEPPTKSDLVADLMTEAPTTADRLRRQPYVRAVADLGAQMADALAYAHAQEIHHRDLKPSNVLLAPDGRPMLLDFNLAYDSEARQQRQGGTLAYMAPEQLAATCARLAPADRPTVDGKADLFALGVVLYELLSGRHPFGPVRPRDPESQIRAQLTERHRAGPRPLHQLVPKVPVALSRLIHACLSADPKQRPTTAHEVARRLRQIAHPRRFTVVRAAVAAVVFVAAAFVWMTVKPSAVEAGVSAYQNREFDVAVVRLQEAVKADPNSARAHFYLGRAFQRKGDHEAALPLLSRAVELNPDGRTFAARAYTLSRLRHWGKALDDFERARAAGLKSTALSHDEGYAALELGNLERAQEWLTEALKRDPKLQIALYCRARVELREAEAAEKDVGRIYVPGKGVADIQEAIKIGPRWALLHRDAAYLLAYCEKHRHHPVGLNGGVAVAGSGEEVRAQLEQAFALGLDLMGYRDSKLLGPWVAQLPKEMTENRPAARPVPPPDFLLDPLGDE